MKLRALTVLVTGLVASPELVAQDERRVDELFARWNRDHSAGAAVAIVMDGEVIHRNGYGMADLERRIRNTPATRFQIASVTKQFTAFAIAMLARRGVLALDDDVRKHLPEVPDFGSTITLRHLIHHTSGLRDVVELMLIAGFQEHDVSDRARNWNLIRSQRELNFEPGSAHQYTNTGYFLLAEVVERVSGTSFREWLARHVFEPLGMRSSHVHDDRCELVTDRAWAYRMASDGTFKHNPTNNGSVGDGGIYSTVEDLAAWIGNMDTGEVGGEAVVTQMRERGRLSSGEELDYAFGVVVDSHRGLLRVSHSGRAAGFLSYLAHYPDQRFGVVVLCNGYPMQPLLDPAALSARIAELYLGEDMADATTASSGPPAAVDVPRDELERVTGWYWHPERNYTRRVVMRGDRLALRFTSGSESPLRPLGDDRFTLDGPTPTTIRFAGENPRRMTVAVEGRSDVFVSVEAPQPPSARDLAEYAGTYFSPELRIAHTFVARDGALVVSSIGRGDAALRPIIRDHFNQGAPWWLGYDIHFQRDAAGRVRGCRVSNYHAANVAFDKLR